jgi:hypothetical protein
MMANLNEEINECRENKKNGHTISSLLAIKPQNSPVRKDRGKMSLVLLMANITY